MGELDPRAEELFHAAADLSPQERAAFLARACAGQDGLRAEVEALLAADEQAVEFLAESPVRSMDTLEPGALLGDFRLVRILGQGGMGVVWEAEERALERRVALKVLHPGFGADEQSRARFRREAEAGARLSHPAIVSVYRVDELDGRPFLVQELVPGARTLADRLDRARRRPELGARWHRETAQLFLRLAEALTVAHEAGVVHRDVKPANILLTRDGEPKLADFGLARLEGALALSRSGEFAGTPFTMSPEQVRGERVDGRSDVFALGATLFEALTLRKAFDGDSTHAILQQILNDDPPDARRIRPGVPADLAVICAKALEKNRARRYASMAEMAQDLSAHLEHRSIRARPAGAWSRARKWGRRHPLLAGAGSVAVVAVVALVTLLVVTLEALDDAHLAREEADAALEESAAQRWLAWSQALVDEDPDLALAFAVHGAERSPGFEANRVLLAALDAPRPRWTMTGHEGPVLDLAFSGSGFGIVSGGQDGTTRFWSIDGPGEQRWCFDDHEGPVTAVAISQNVWAGDASGTVTELHVTERSELRRIEDLSLPVDDLVLSSGAVHAVDCTGEVLRWASGRGRTEWTSRAIEAEDREGTHLLEVGGSGSLVIAPPLGRAARWTREAGSADVTRFGGRRDQLICLRVAVDGVLWTVDRERGVQRFDLESLQPLEEPRPLRASRALLDRHGRVLAVVDPQDPTTVQLLDATTLTSMGVLRSRSAAQSLAFSHGGRRLAVGGVDGTIRVWELGLRTTLAGFDLDWEGVRDLALSADGSRLALVTDDPARNVVVLDDELRMQERTEARADHAVHRVAWAAGGDRLTLGTDGRVRGPSWVNGDQRPTDGRAVWAVSPASDRYLVGCEAGLTFQGGGYEQVLQGLRADPVAACFAPSGARFAALDPGARAVHLWTAGEAAPGRSLPWTLEEDGGSRKRAHPQALAFDGDGRRLAVGESSGRVRVWDVETGRELQRLHGRGGRVTAVAFGPEGRRLVAGASDGAATLWDLENGAQVLLVGGHGGPVDRIAMHPDGASVVSLSSSVGRVRRWPTDPLGAARAAGVRAVEPEEAARYDLELER